MSITYGFYNSFNHDRKYNANQISSMFDGVIRDGVFSTIGDSFIVNASGTGLTVNVGTGKAWFNNTWTLNDAVLQLTLDSADVALDRIDAVVIEVDASTLVRANDIKIVKGTPSSNPVRPTLTNTEDVHQYAIAYISVNHSVSTLLQTHITNNVGSSGCPFVSGLLQQISTDELVQQWETEFGILLTRLQEELAEVEEGVAFEFKPIRSENITVLTSSFLEYTPSGDEEIGLKNDLGYSYRAGVQVEGVLSSMIPYITVSLPSMDAAGISIANQFRAYNGGFYIYADGVPSSNIRVLTAEFRKPVVNV